MKEKRAGSSLSEGCIRYWRLVVCGVAMLLGPVACGSDSDDNGNGSEPGPTVCEAIAGAAQAAKTAKLYFEWNSTDDDTGIHGMMTGSSDWQELCVRAPDGEGFLHVNPQGKLKDFGMSDVFFESREPAADVISQADVLSRFPAGDWEVYGRTIGGEAYRGVAKLTHDIPLPPEITAPAEDAVVDPTDVVVTWEPVTKTVAGADAKISGYEVIVTNETKSSDSPDKNGMSLPVISTHVIPSVTSLKIPEEFFEPETEYELEVLAIEESGNQTITIIFFKTGKAGSGRSKICEEIAGAAQEAKNAKLYFEWNSTDDDTGIHGLMTGSSDWKELCVRAPDGKGFLHVSPQGNLKEFGMADIFFESREPAADVISQADVLSRYPAGEWEVYGRTIDGEAYRGVAKLTHDIPLPPEITAPAEDAIVDPANVVVTWEPVTKTVAGADAKITGYEVIVTNETKSSESPDKNGMSLPVTSTHVLPSVASLKIPEEFFEPETEYELEVIAIEESGNQTISISFFNTPAS
jgi:hypothetical protein